MAPDWSARWKLCDGVRVAAARRITYINRGRGRARRIAGSAFRMQVSA
jgi:hypothetical protein